MAFQSGARAYSDTLLSTLDPYGELFMVFATGKPSISKENKPLELLQFIAISVFLVVGLAIASVSFCFEMNEKIKAKIRNKNKENRWVTSLVFRGS